MNFYNGTMVGYNFFGINKNGKILFGDTFWYPNTVEPEEIEDDLEDYCLEQLAIYNFENKKREKVYGKCELIA